MKRIFWFTQLVFTGWGLMFFIGLHLSQLILLRLPDVFVRSGIVVFGLGLIPMWTVVVFSIARGKWKERGNWMEEMIAEFPHPQISKKLFKIFWCYSCLILFVGIVVPESMGGWAIYLRGVGLPGIFMGFYGFGFLCAWANWKKANRIDPSTSAR